MSRYEKIKQMSIKEIAEFLCNFCRNAETCYGCIFEDDCPESESIDAWKEWLNEQSEPISCDREKGGWISVDERLPEAFVNVLVNDGAVTIDHISCGGEWYYHNHHAVTHWMPLPEPPKGE